VPNALPIGEVLVDLRVLIFAAVLIAITGLGFGAHPPATGKQKEFEAFDGARAGGGIVSRAERPGGSGGHGSIVLLITSGLLMRGLADHAIRRDSVPRE